MLLNGQWCQKADISFFFFIFNGYTEDFLFHGPRQITTTFNRRQLSEIISLPKYSHLNIQQTANI